MRVVFVCFANICRSPMAEAVFLRMLEEAGLADAISADSCGTDACRAGETPARGTLDALAENGITDYTHIARPITPRDLEGADYLIVMDQHNLADVMAMGEPRGRVARLMDFAPQIDVRDVPDPFYDYTGHAHKTVYKLVELACRGLLDHIVTEHNLA
jgi:protein-tyrosine phosphatase